MRLDLEYKIQLITQTRMGLATSVSDLMAIGNDFDPESPATKMLQQRQTKLNALEKKLEMQMQAYQGRLAAIQKEEESCKALLEQNVARAFSYGGGGGR
jgi:predicted  nucleic acid-binding Zn-ribbon protein